MIRCVIQHHPSREHLLPDLLDKLEGFTPVVVVHSSTPPSPWAGYRRCLSSVPDDCSHLLIVQDDAYPVPGFAAALPEIAAANPDIPVCLFLASFPRDTKPRPEMAMKMKRRYVTLSLRSFFPVVAVLWPREKAIEAYEWTTLNPKLHGANEPRSDDAMLGRWKLRTRQAVLATVPSIVQHEDIEPSTIGLTKMWRNRRRQAAFIADDARDYDWSMP